MLQIAPSTDAPARVRAANLILFVTQDAAPAASGVAKEIDAALDGALSQLADDGELTGKRGQIVTVHVVGPAAGRIVARRVLVVGLGNAAKADLDALRNVTAEAARRARALASGDLSIALGNLPAGFDETARTQAVAEGLVLGLYRFDRHQAPSDPINTVGTITITGSDRAAVERGITVGTVSGDAANFARNLANEPSNILTPTELAARAQALAEETGLACEILEAADVERLGMGSFLGVARGSHQPPKFIILRHRGGGSEPDIGYVGKGITFDTGGISLKPAENMEAMKQDMSGAAAVIAAMGALAKLNVPVSVTALAPATENMPGGNAIKPGDVLRAMNGKTIEVINTDAEGRLILADALSYANHLGLSPLIDVATLTGACVVALGEIATGLMSNNDPLSDEVREAGRRAGEKIWPLPMYDEYDEQIKSAVADVKNTGGRPAGAITAAKFLSKFVEDTPWAHLDMAGTDDSSKDSGVLVKGASGVPVRTLIQFALARAAVRGQA